MNETSGNMTLEQAVVDQQEQLKAVTDAVISSLSNSHLSVKEMKRAIMSHLDPTNDNRVRKLSDKELILFSNLNTHREQLIKFLAVNHALEMKNKE